MCIILITPFVVTWKYTNTKHKLFFDRKTVQAHEKPLQQCFPKSSGSHGCSVIFLSLSFPAAKKLESRTPKLYIPATKVLGAGIEQKYGLSIDRYRQEP